MITTLIKHFLYVHYHPSKNIPPLKTSVKSNFLILNNMVWL